MIRPVIQRTRNDTSNECRRPYCAPSPLTVKKWPPSPWHRSSYGRLVHPFDTVASTKTCQDIHTSQVHCISIGVFHTRSLPLALACLIGSVSWLRVEGLQSQMKQKTPRNSCKACWEQFSFVIRSAKMCVPSTSSQLTVHPHLHPIKTSGRKRLSCILRIYSTTNTTSCHVLHSGLMVHLCMVSVAARDVHLTQNNPPSKLRCQQVTILLEERITTFLIFHHSIVDCAETSTAPSVSEYYCAAL